ncbi:MAG: hypothetical protein ACYSU0_15335 [Planctomycetota bacterium]|jgi:hypothetical protein
MKEIAIHEIAGGEVLAADVTDERGNLLLSSGAALDQTHVEVLERRGVLAVKIVEPDSDGEGGTAAPSDDEFERALSRLDHMFEGSDDDPVMRAIYSAARGMLESARREEGTGDA